MEGIYQENNYYRDLLIQAQSNKASVQNQTAPAQAQPTTTGGLPMISITSLKLDDPNALSDAFPQPTLFLPETNPYAVDFTKLIATLRQKMNEASYLSSQQKLNADSSSSSAKNDRLLNQLLDVSMSMASLTQASTAAVTAGQNLNDTTQVAAEVGLSKAQRKEQALEATASLAKDNYANDLAAANAKVNQANIALTNAQQSQTDAQQAVDKAQQDKTDATANLADAQAQLDKLLAVPQDPNNPDEQLQADIKTAQDGVTKASGKLDQVNTQLTAAQNALNAADQKVADAQQNLIQAQNDLANVDRSQLDKANADLAAQQQKIASEQYEVDVTQVLPKTTELITANASFIDQIAAANPQMAINQNFLSSLGITPQEGVSTTQALTGELSRRLEASGMSSGEAEALATLVMTGQTSAINSLPKTTLDVIQNFTNDVNQAALQANESALNALEQASAEIGKIPPETVKALNVLYVSLTEGQSLEAEENPITAFLKLMGEAIDMIIELADEQYKERLDIEQQMENHI